MSISDLDPAVPGSDGPAGQGDDELRTIKAALVEAFPAVDGPITNTGGTIDPPDAATWSALFTRLTAVEAEASSGAGFVGEIKTYYGVISSIPTGWHLCDGSNQTPNLIGRFLIAADGTSGLPTYGGDSFGGAVGAAGLTGPAGSHQHQVGGMNDHVLVTANLPAHDHALFVVDEVGGNAGADPGANARVASKGSYGDSAKAYAMSASGQTAPSGISGQGAGVAQGLIHTGVVDMAAAHQHTIGDDDSLPPWAAMYFIMFTGA